jgi:hypothetical protein
MVLLPSGDFGLPGHVYFSFCRYSWTITALTAASGGRVCEINALSVVVLGTPLGSFGNFIRAMTLFICTSGNWSRPDDLLNAIQKSFVTRTKGVFKAQQI